MKIQFVLATVLASFFSGLIPTSAFAEDKAATGSKSKTVSCHEVFKFAAGTTMEEKGAAINDKTVPGKLVCWSNSGKKGQSQAELLKIWQTEARRDIDANKAAVNELSVAFNAYVDSNKALLKKFEEATGQKPNNPSLPPNEDLEARFKALEDAQDEFGARIGEKPLKADCLAGPNGGSYECRMTNILAYQQQNETRMLALEANDKKQDKRLEVVEKDIEQLKKAPRGGNNYFGGKPDDYMLLGLECGGGSDSNFVLPRGGCALQVGMVFGSNDKWLRFGVIGLPGLGFSNPKVSPYHFDAALRGEFVISDPAKVTDPKYDSLAQAKLGAQLSTISLNGEFENVFNYLLVTGGVTVQPKAYALQYGLTFGFGGASSANGLSAVGQATAHVALLPWKLKKKSASSKEKP